MRRMPPMKMKPAAMKMPIPVTQDGIPKAWLKASAIEFDCTMLPMKPSAMMIATEKNAARGLFPRPRLM